MKGVRLAPRARADFAEILRTSDRKFGPTTRRRYRLLLEQALRDVAEDAARIGVNALEGGLFAYHLRHSRDRVPMVERVSRPRHFLVFRAAGDDLVVVRVLHDAMDPFRHLGGTDGDI